MSAAAIVTIILAVVVILVLAVSLLAVARVLVGVNGQLGSVIASVGKIATMTEPVNPVVKSIDGNLGTARDVLTSLLVSKVGVEGAAELVASVDPMADAPVEEGTMRFRGGRAPGDVPAAEPPSVRYSRVGEGSAPLPPAARQAVAEPAPNPVASSFSGAGAIRLIDPDPDLAPPAPDRHTPAPRAAELRAPEPQAPAPPAAEPAVVPFSGGGAIRLIEPDSEPEPEPKPEPAEPEPEPEQPSAPFSGGGAIQLRDTEAEPEPSSSPFSGGGTIRFRDSPES